MFINRKAHLVNTFVLPSQLQHLATFVSFLPTHIDTDALVLGFYYTFTRGF